MYNSIRKILEAKGQSTELMNFKDNIEMEKDNDEAKDFLNSKKTKSNTKYKVKIVVEDSDGKIRKYVIKNKGISKNKDEELINKNAPIYIEAKKAFLEGDEIFKAVRTSYKLLDFYDSELISHKITDHKLMDYEPIDRPYIEILNVYDKKKGINHQGLRKKIGVKVLGLKRNDFIYIEVEKCTCCDQYYIDSESLKFYQKHKGLMGVKFIPSSGNANNSSNEHYDDFKTESILHLYGYNASPNGPEQWERQKLLQYLLDYDRLTRNQMHRHIEFLITTRGHRSPQALPKWESDREFLIKAQKADLYEIEVRRINLLNR